MTTTFNPDLAPALLADPANLCAATLQTSMYMASLSFDRKGADIFAASLKECSEADAARARQLAQRLTELSADIDAFTKDCRARVAGAAQ